MVQWSNSSYQRTYLSQPIFFISFATHIFLISQGKRYSPIATHLYPPPGRNEYPSRLPDGTPVPQFWENAAYLRFSFFVILKPLRSTDHCRTLGCKMGCAILVLGEMEVTRMNLYRSGQGIPSALGLVRTPSGVGTIFKWGGGQGHRQDFLLGMESKNYLPSNPGPSSDLGHFILIICQTKENFVTFMKKCK